MVEFSRKHAEDVVLPKEILVVDFQADIRRELDELSELEAWFVAEMNKALGPAIYVLPEAGKEEPVLAEAMMERLRLSFLESSQKARSAQVEAGDPDINAKDRIPKKD